MSSGIPQGFILELPGVLTNNYNNFVYTGKYEIIGGPQAVYLKSPGVLINNYRLMLCTGKYFDRGPSRLALSGPRVPHGRTTSRYCEVKCVG